MQLKLPGAAVIVLLLCSVTQTTTAETFGIGSSSQGSSTYRLATALATVIGKHEGLAMRAEPRSGTSMTVPLVNAAQLDFSLGNPLEAGFAYHGTGTFEGRENPNLRLVSALYPVKVALFVRADSKIRVPNDLKGKRIPTGFKGQNIIPIVIRSLLANAGLKPGDINPVPVLNLSEARREFVAGRVDTFIGVIGSGTILETSRLVGGLRALPADSSEPALVRARNHMTMFTTRRVEPAPNLTSVEIPMSVLTYHFFLYTHKGTPDDLVYRIVQTIDEHHDELADIIKPFQTFDPAEMNTEIGVPFHPGALQYFRDKRLQ